MRNALACASFFLSYSTFQTCTKILDKSKSKIKLARIINLKKHFHLSYIGYPYFNCSLEINGH